VAFINAVPQLHEAVFDLSSTSTGYDALVEDRERATSSKPRVHLWLTIGRDIQVQNNVPGRRRYARGQAADDVQYTVR
jgi:hypothetical protein